MLASMWRQVNGLPRQGMLPPRLQCRLRRPLSRGLCVSPHHVSHNSNYRGSMFPRLRPRNERLSLSMYTDNQARGREDEGSREGEGETEENLQLIFAEPNPEILSLIIRTCRQSNTSRAHNRGRRRIGTKSTMKIAIQQPLPQSASHPRLLTLKTPPSIPRVRTKFSILGYPFIGPLVSWIQTSPCKSHIESSSEAHESFSRRRRAGSSK
ncbi:hypothetical protein V8C26DRAFT_62208 [Trichoderma gracile]